MDITIKLELRDLANLWTIRNKVKEARQKGDHLETIKPFFVYNIFQTYRHDFTLNALGFFDLKILLRYITPKTPTNDKNNVKDKGILTRKGKSKKHL